MNPSLALFAASAAPLSDAVLYDAAYRMASPARQKKADRYHFQKDRILSLGAELLLRYAFRQFGLPCFPAEFVCDGNGKPRQKDGGLCFNLSHSGEYVLCAVSDLAVGCDLEKVTPIDLSVAKRFFFEAEYDDIAAQETPQAQADLFFRYWTLKESFLKFTGLGMKLPLDSFRIVRGAEISVVSSADHLPCHFAEFQEIPGYKCALCAMRAPEALTLKTVDLKKILNGSEIV